MEIVGARLGDNIGDSAAGASKLGGIAAAVDLKFFHRIDAELIGRAPSAGSAESLAIKVVVIVAAVHQVTGLVSANSAECEIPVGG